MTEKDASLFLFFKICLQTLQCPLQLNRWRLKRSRSRDSHWWQRSLLHRAKLITETQPLETLNCFCTLWWLKSLCRCLYFHTELCWQYSHTLHLLFLSNDAPRGFIFFLFFVPLALDLRLSHSSFKNNFWSWNVAECKKQPGENDEWSLINTKWA